MTDATPSLPTLLSCPFCGHETAMGTVTYHPDSDDAKLNGQTTFFRVNCVCCGVQNGMLLGYRTAEKAAEYWNRRAPQPVPPSAPVSGTLLDVVRQRLDDFQRYVQGAADDGTREAHDAMYAAKNRLLQAIAFATPPVAAPSEDRQQLLDEIIDLADHGIPVYSYGDHEAACDMASRLARIANVADAARREETP